MSRWSDGRKQLISLGLIFGAAVLICAGGVLGAVWLTREVSELTNPPAPSPAPTDGVLILSVAADSPAAQANLTPGHVLLRLNNSPITSPEMLSLLLANLPAEAEYSLLVMDEAGVLWQTTAVRAVEPPYLGVEIATWSRTSPEPAEAGPTPTAPVMTLLPVVTGIVSGSPAAAADIQVGDIVTAVDGAAILNGEELLNVMAGKQPGESITLTLRRGEETLLRTAALGSHPDDPQRGFMGIEFQP